MVAWSSAVLSFVYQGWGVYHGVTTRSTEGESTNLYHGVNIVMTNEMITAMCLSIWPTSLKLVSLL